MIFLFFSLPLIDLTWFVLVETKEINKIKQKICVQKVFNKNLIFNILTLKLGSECVWAVAAAGGCYRCGSITFSH